MVLMLFQPPSKVGNQTFTPASWNKQTNYFNLYKKRYSNVEKNINNNNKEYSFNWIEHF